jgi:hypothetical protein
LSGALSAGDRPERYETRLAGDVTCPGCGEGFACGADRPASDPCWCTRVTLPGLVLDRLATTFEGCLCPTCLGQQAAPPGA